MPDATSPTAKPWWQSKTILLNILALVAMAVPAVAGWVKENPVEPVAVLTALNLILRFVTSGKISIFGDDDDFPTGLNVPGSERGKTTAGRDAGGNAGESKERHTPGFPWLVGPACVALLLLLPGCMVGVDGEGNYSVRPDPRTMDVALKYLIRHEEDEDSKGGLVEWEYYDPATGEEIAEEDYAVWGIKP
jgi:hypothetical protein